MDRHPAGTTPSRSPAGRAPGRRAAALAALLTLAAALISVGSGFGLAGAPAAAGAAPMPATTASTGAEVPPPPSTAPVPLPSPDIIPQPNSGHAPRDAGERGGSQQTLVFLLVCAGVLTVFGLAWRESRRKRAALARAAGGSEAGRGSGAAGRAGALSKS